MHQHLVSKNKHKPNLYLKLGFLVFSFCILIIYFFTNSIPDSYLTPLEVKISESSNMIKGIGTVQPYERKLVSTPVEATISKLSIRPGQRVKQGELLIQLQNFDLEQKLENARLAITILESKKSIEQGNLKISESKLNTELLRAKTVSKQLSLELNANEKLAKKGIISSITLQKAKLAFEQSELDIVAKEQELKFFNDSNKQKLSSHDIEISIAKERFNFLEEQKNSLTVIADKDYLIVKVFGNLGSNLNKGAALVEMIEADKFLIEVQVPQFSVHKIIAGLSANILTPHGAISAKVKHIDKVIRNGSSTVYLDLNEKAPDWISPEQSIEAEILLSENSEIVKFVKTPENYGDHSQWYIYQIDTTGNATKLGLATKSKNSPANIIVPSEIETNFVLILPSDYATQNTIKNIL